MSVSFRPAARENVALLIGLAGGTGKPERTPHPAYGPCDGFGPNGTCSECTGTVESQPSEYPRDAIRAAHAEGFRRGVAAAALTVEDKQHPLLGEHAAWLLAKRIRALRPEGEKT